MESLYKTILFQSWSASEVDCFLKLVPHRIVDYKKQETVLSKGMMVEELGIVLQGSLFIQDIDFWGNRTILTRIEETDIFAETFACLHLPIHVDVIASCPSKVLFISPHLMMKQDNRLANQFVKLLAQKNFTLTSKIRHVSMRSTQAKLLTYLSDVAWHKQSNSFKIPYNRQELADYLAVDRSALSLVLSKLEKEGYLQYYKNSFILQRKER